MRQIIVYVSVFVMTLLLGVAVTSWMWHCINKTQLIDQPQPTCSVRAHTVVLAYDDFGPPSMSYRLQIGNAWNQWKNEGHALPDDVDIKVVVYRNIQLEEVKKEFPVITGKSDYRYLEYDRAIQVLREEIKSVETYKEEAILHEFRILEELDQTLKKPHCVIVERLGV